MPRKVRLKDIADETGVSIGTVSYVLNHADVPISEEVRTRVLAAAKKLNYTTNWAAKSLKLQHNNAIGVVVEDMRSWFLPPLIDGICRYAEESDVRVLLCNLRADSKANSMSHQNLSVYQAQIAEQVRNTFGNQVDGLLYIAAFNRDVSDVFLPENDRTVFVYCHCVDSRKYPSVHYNDWQGAELATRYLLEKGHRKIAYVNGLGGETTPGQKRRDAFLSTMQAYQLPVEPEMVMDCSNWSFESLEHLLSSDKRPTAVFVNMDALCEPLYDICHRLKIRIPEELSVIGFDNYEVSWHLRPRLTTISFPADEIGYQAARLVCEKTENTGEYLLDCSLIERESVQKV